MFYLLSFRKKKKAGKASKVFLGMAGKATKFRMLAKLHASFAKLKLVKKLKRFRLYDFFQ